MIRGRHMILLAVLIGALGAAIMATAISSRFVAFATETNEEIIEKFGTGVKARQELESLHFRIRHGESGMRSFLATRILANNGLGFPETKSPGVEMWIWPLVVGAIIGFIAGAKKWWAVPVIIVAGIWGLAASAGAGPVANTIIFLSGALGGTFALIVVLILTRKESSDYPEKIYQVNPYLFLLVIGAVIAIILGLGFVISGSVSASSS